VFEGNLADLEELVLSVRDRNSREYIGEAVVDYQSRCYRSAISAAWVAITYDIISKIRELSVQGDAQARNFIERVDRAIALRVADPVESKKQLQAIEGELLVIAHDTFEFLTDHDLRDMTRLRDDRHLCAHPAFAGEDYLFQPSPELVRTHLVHAIVDLLQHPPIQGKSSLVRLKNDLIQPSFPSTQATVSEFLDDRYLRHIKTGLINNLITVFLKVTIKQVEPDLIGKEERIIMCLVAVSRRHQTRFAQQMRQELPRLSDGCNDDELRRVMRLFRADPRCWQWLGRPNQVRITEIVKYYSYDAATLDSVASCLEIPELRPLFVVRAETFTLEQKRTLYSRHPHQVFIDDAIKQYGEAGSFRGAEALFETMIRPFVSMFRSEHIRTVVDSAKENAQIYCASETPVQLAYLFGQTQDLVPDTASCWQEFLRHVLNVYDKDDSIYVELRKRMMEAGIWPIS
jgi:hypothetical protein